MSHTAQETGSALLPAELREELLDMVVQSKIELPVLPEVASQVIAASMDEECDLRHLTTLIGSDQSMTGHLLRLSNCALYAPAVPIVSLQQALNRLGLKKIREIAIIASCESKVFRVAGFDLAVRGLFRHSLAAAAFAQEVARRRGDSIEESFLGGLLHDVGRPVLLQTIVELKESMGLDVERAVIEEASAEFHCRVGAELVRSWGLPDRLGEAILHHHDPPGTVDMPEQAMATRLADELAHLAVGPRKRTEEDLRNNELLDSLGLGEEEIEALLAVRSDVLGMIESMS